MSVSPIAAGYPAPMFGSPAGGPGKAKASGDAVQEFLDYANQSPAEQMRANILKSMGISEDDLKAMDPKKRKAVEEEIAERLKQQVRADTEKKTGLITDLKA